MLSYTIRRLAVLVPILWVVATIVFLIMHFLPGDPAELMLRGVGGASPAQITEVRKQLGLDDPILVQYARFIWSAVHGNLGKSIRLKTDVSKVISRTFPYTAQLSVGAFVVSICIGIPLGIVAALKQRTWVDASAMVISLLGVSMPVFWLGLLLIFAFSFALGWLPPISPDLSLRSLILPSVALGSINAGLLARLVRANLLEVLQCEYIRTARARGLVEYKVVFYHALRNALIPTVTVLGLQFARMLTGAAVTETVFSRPGLGRLVVESVIWKDFPLVRGSILFAAVLFLGMNLLVDLVYAWLDPRIHYT